MYTCKIIHTVYSYVDTHFPSYALRTGNFSHFPIMLSVQSTYTDIAYDSKTWDKTYVSQYKDATVFTSSFTKSVYGC